MNGGVREIAEPGASRNILVTATIDNRALEPPADDGQTDHHTIAVLPNNAVDDWVDKNTDRVGEDSLTVISVDGHDTQESDSESADETGKGDRVGSQSGDRQSVDIDADEPTVVMAVQPNELAPLCKTIYDALRTAEDVSVDLRVDALDDIIDAVPLRYSFILLVTLTAMVDKYDAHAIYRLDPDSHDDQVLHTLEPLFDEHVA